MDRIIIIAGATAVGKTEYSIEIAKTVGGEIISCDSMQLYKFMDIGSAKPAKEDLLQVRHYLIDVVDPREKFSVALYADMAKHAIKDILAKGCIPVVTGGTGLYMNALIYDMDFSAAPVCKGYRKKLKYIAAEQGYKYLHDMLREADPGAAERIHPNNLKKVIRALERASAEKEPIKDFSGLNKKTEDYEVILIGLKRDREDLYERINNRVDKIVKSDLTEEVSGLLAMGLTEDDISMKGIGYKEMIGYLNGRYDKDEAVRLIKRNTRHYAKRQMTWFRRYDDMKWFDLSRHRNSEDALEDIQNWLKTQL